MRTIWRFKANDGDVICEYLSVVFLETSLLFNCEGNHDLSILHWEMVEHSMKSRTGVIISILATLNSDKASRSKRIPHIVRSPLSPILRLISFPSYCSLIQSEEINLEYLEPPALATITAFLLWNFN